MGLGDGIADVHLQTVTFVDIVASVKKAAVEIVDIKQEYIQSPAVKTECKIDLRLEGMELQIRCPYIPPHVGIDTVVPYIRTGLDIRSSGIQAAP